MRRARQAIKVSRATPVTRTTATPTRGAATTGTATTEPRTRAARASRRTGQSGECGFVGFPPVVRHRAPRPRRDAGDEGEGIRALLPEPEQAARRGSAGHAVQPVRDRDGEAGDPPCEGSVECLRRAEPAAGSGCNWVAVQPLRRRRNEAAERPAEAVVQSSNGGGRPFSTRAGPGVDASARLPHGRHARRPDHGPSGAGCPLGHAGRATRAPRDARRRRSRSRSKTSSRAWSATSFPMSPGSAIPATWPSFRVRGRGRGRSAT